MKRLLIGLIAICLLWPATSGQDRKLLTGAGGPSAGGCTATLRDDFNRANSADLGVNWDSGYTGRDPLQLVSNAVRVTTVGVDARESWNVDSFNANQCAEVTITTMSGGVGAIMVGLNLRGVAPATVTSYVFQAHKNRGDGKTSAITTEGGTDLVSESSTTWIGGDVLRGEVQSTALRLYRNGALLLSATDSSIASGGRISITIAVDSGATSDAVVDNFKAGSFP